MFNQPIPHETNETPPEVLNELFGRITSLEKLGNEVAAATPVERQRMLQDIQDKLDALKDQYRDHTVEFKALLLAWEATRLAWYVIGQGHDGGKLFYTEEAFEELKQLIIDN